MLRKTSPEVDRTNEQIERCERFLALVPEMEESETLDFNVVHDRANDADFMCWYGRYRRENSDAVAFNSSTIAGYIGCRPDEVMRMFGPGSSGGLHDRIDYMKAHISELESRRADAA